jgi:hypothetical protein
MKRALRPLLWCTAIALLFAPALGPRRADAPRAPSFALRLLGPIASLAASVQWVRVDSAIRAGRTDVALARAETALAIDPGSTVGWNFLSRYMALDLGSRAREPDTQRRLAWIKAALAVAERGEKSARAPSELALWRGLVLSTVVAYDEDLPWPGGAAGKWNDAAACFDRAAALGDPEAAQMAAIVRAKAAESH